ncbi:MAG TPA: efflux RND transporter periplasmic adaptor subunit [Syntrophorhabdaceae bacterium]|nr:efflux RND transporter periplasmic adaptor subunit [Syntrophorhabdaceae bacterium]
MISKKKIIPLAVIAAAVIVAVIVVMSFVRGRDDGTMKLSGNVEVTECNVGFKVAGKIRALKVDEGARVKEGDLIAELSSGDVKALVDQNRAALEEARVKLAELKAGSRRQEIVKARADSASLEAELVKARKDFERAGTLYENGAISASRFDAAKSAYETRLGQLKSARQQQSLVEEGPRREDIRAAELRVKQLEALVANTEEKLADTRLYAPISGVVFRKNVELGEIVQPGAAVFTIGDLDRPWVKVYVKEDKLALVKLGQKARITVDTYKDRSYEGTVTFISSDAEFTPKNVQTQEERVKLVFGVKVTVTNRDQELKPGMPADVRISLK